MMYCLFRHVCEWTILPWIATDVAGWEFTWVFFAMGYVNAEHQDDFFEDVE